MTDIDKLVFAAAEPGDERSIVDLFQACYSRSLPEEVWRWRFQKCPAGQGVVELAWDSGILAGHYAVTPVSLSMDGQDYLAGLSGTTMTHPNYRGLGLFPVLARRTYARMQTSGMALVFGFPNANSHRGFVKDLNWTDIYEVPTLSLPMEPTKQVPEPSSNVWVLDHFDNRFDALWNRLRRRPEMMGRRDTATLTWRYTLNPLETYRILGYLQEEDLLGYAVFKSYKDRLQVVDLCALEVEVEHELMKKTIEMAQDSSCRAVDMWLSVHRPLHWLLERYGFVNSTPVTYLGALRLGTQLPDVAVHDWRNWYLTMGDSDVF